MTRSLLKQPALGALVLLKMSEVRQRTGLGRSEIYRRIAMGVFPRPVKLGARASAWPAHEVEAWAAARIAERDGAMP